MHSPARGITAAAVLLVVAVAGCQSGSGNGGTGGEPTSASSPAPARLASGNFRFPPMDAAVVLDASGAGSDATGTLTVSNDEMSFAVDLECALRTEDGRILIGGDTTESTFDTTPKGTRTAIVLKAGSPVQAIFAWQGTDQARAPSCTAFLEDQSPDTVDLVPINGTIDFES
jgi:hypothetical protein